MIIVNDFKLRLITKYEIKKIYHIYSVIKWVNFVFCVIRLYKLKVKGTSAVILHDVNTKYIEIKNIS